MIPLTEYAPVFLTIVCVCIGALLFMVFVILRSKKNSALCYQFITSKGMDGKDRADGDKVTKIMFFMLLALIMIYREYIGKLDNELIYFAVGAAAGVVGWNSWNKAKNGPEQGDKK